MAGLWVALTGIPPAVLAHELPEEAAAEAADEPPDDEVRYGSHARAAQARPPTASSETVTARTLSVTPIRTAEDALRLVPGLVVVQHGSEGKGQQLYLRGFDAMHGADLELTVEGIPVNEWSNVHAQGYVDLGFVLPETVERVDVVKGPFTTDQGAFALAGSADYQLGIPEDARGARIAYSIGSTLRQRGVASYSPKDGDGQDFLALEATHDPGFGQNRTLDRASLLGRVRLVDDAHAGTLSLLASGYFADFGLPGTVREDDLAAGRIGFYDSYDRAGHGRSARGLLALHHDLDRTRTRLQSHAYAGYRDLSLLENYTGALYDPVNGDRREQDQQGFTFGARTVASTPVHPTVLLRTGAGMRGDVFSQSQAHLGQREQDLGTERALDAVQTLSHVGAELRWRPTDALRIAAGARFNLMHVRVQDRTAGGDERTGTLWALSPRALLEWRAHPDLRLFAAYGRGFRPPEARAFTDYVPGDVGLSEDLYDGGEPGMTLSDSLELGLRAYFGHHLELQVSGFGTWIASESLYDHVSGVNLALDGTQRLGGELVVSVLATDWLTFTGSATYVNARFRRSGNPVPQVPPLVGSAQMVLVHPSGVRAGVRFFALAPRPLPHGAQGAPWTQLDASVGYHWRWLRLDLAVENLLNQRIREGEYHYASDWDPSDPPSRLPVLHTAAGPPLLARLTLGVVF